MMIHSSSWVLNGLLPERKAPRPTGTPATTSSCGPSAVELDQDAERVAARFALEAARRRAGSSLPSVADHPGAPADASFDDAPIARASSSAAIA